MYLMKVLSLFLAIVTATQGSELDGGIKNDSKVPSSALRKRGHRKLSSNSGSSNDSGGETEDDRVPPATVTTPTTPVTVTTPAPPVQWTNLGGVGVTLPSATCESFLGFGQGIKPLVRPTNLPTGLERGECIESSHCQGTDGRCCLKNFCLCGSADATRSTCMD